MLLMILLILLMSKPNTNINTFKKSIESTVKAISKKSDINILFGSDKKLLPKCKFVQVNKDKLYKSRLRIRGRSDSHHLLTDTITIKFIKKCHLKT